MVKTDVDLISKLPVRRPLTIAVACAVVLFGAAGRLAAQAPTPSGPGAIAVSAAVDFPSVYFFRGFRQEDRPKLTFEPHADVDVRLYTGDRELKSVSASFGTWNSFHSGSSGSKGSTGRSYYEADFSSGVALAFANGLDVDAGYTAFTSPNGSFSRVQEMSVRAGFPGAGAPYGQVAFELSGQTDEGAQKGIYLELGAVPEWPIGRRTTIAVPIALGVSLKDYYEGPAGESRFGFFSAGVHGTVVLNRTAGRFGQWEVHGGLDVLALGDTARALNREDAGQIVVVGGIGLSY